MYDEEGNPIQEQVADVTKTAGAEETKTQLQENIKGETDRRSCPLSNNIIEMLVKQLGCEIANHNLYRTFANYFSTEGLDRLAIYYNKRAEEEMNHHQWIFDYLTENDAVFQYPPIVAVNVTINDRKTPFELTVDKEIETTLGINRIVSAAFEEKDWATYKWLDKLVAEQVEEESTSRSARDIANEEGSWLRKEKSILSLYEAATR